MSGFRFRSAFALTIASTLMAGCASTPQQHVRKSASSAVERGYYKIGDPYQIEGVTYTPAEDWNYDETGIAPGTDRTSTASGPPTASFTT